MWSNLLAKYTIIIFLAILVYLLFKDKNLFLKTIASCLCVWILNRFLETVNLYFLKFFPNTFPSDHTAIGSAVGISIFFKRKILGLILILLAILMGCARVWVNLHEFSDIIAGAITGIICSFLMNIYLPTGRK